MRIVLLGAPGVGKGTYADCLSKKLNIVHISTGNILRDAVKFATELGNKAKEYMEKGQLVPDGIMIDLVEDRLKDPDVENGFILDGFPRTVYQANSLKSVLDKLVVRLDIVINIEASVDTLIKRLTTRVICKNCGANFNTLTMKPKKDGTCDYCASQLYHREDDREDVIKKRLIVYKNDTAPLIDYYSKSGLLKTVNSDAEIEDVIAKIEKIMENNGVRS